MNHEKLKVLHFYKTYYPNSYGGVEQVIFQLCEGTATYGIDSIVLSLNNCDKNKNLSIKHHHVVYAPTNFKIASTPFSFKAIKYFRQIVEQVNIIHFHFPFPFMDIVNFLVKHNKPTLVTYHSDIIKQKFLLKIYTPLMYRFLDSVNCIVASSPNYIVTSPILRRYESKITLIPFGLNRTLYPLINKKKEEEWQNRIGTKFFLFIGSFRYYKGLYTLVKAAHITKYTLVLIGFGSMEYQLKKYCAKLGLKNVYFLGALSDENKVSLLNICYSVILPSNLRTEAFGIALLEGAMYGKPLISCEIGTGTSYINLHKQTGLVVPPSQPAKLAAAMSCLWNNPQLARYYGRQAYKRFNTLFKSTHMINSYVKLYQDLKKI